MLKIYLLGDKFYDSNHIHKINLAKQILYTKRTLVIQY